MTSYESNPFLQDVERQTKRTPGLKRWKSLARRLCIVIGSVALVVFMYLIIRMDLVSGHKVTFNATSPVKRWPTTTEISTTETGTMNSTLPDTMNWMSPITTPTWTATAWTTSIWPTSPWTIHIFEVSASPSVSSSTVETDPPIDQQGAAVFPTVPSASLCIPHKMQEDEFVEKQMICQECWNGNYSSHNTAFKSEEAYSHSCYNKCFDNDIYKQCAHTLEMILLLQAA